MKFRNQTTFNMRDATMVKGERIIVKHDIRQRCELVLDVLNKNRSGLTISEITDVLNARRRNRYSEGDVAYAVKRLRQTGIIECNTHDQYVFSVGARSALQRWANEMRDSEWI